MEMSDLRREDFRLHLGRLMPACLDLGARRRVMVILQIAIRLFRIILLRTGSHHRCHGIAVLISPRSKHRSLA